jgi:hypothetical protein
MAVRYGMPVSEFLERHTSAELTELMAYFALQAKPPHSEPQAAADPEQQARLIKQALFKGT